MKFKLKIIIFVDGISFGIHRLMSDEKHSSSENESPGTTTIIQLLLQICTHNYIKTLTIRATKIITIKNIRTTNNNYSYIITRTTVNRFLVGFQYSLNLKHHGTSSF